MPFAENVSNSAPQTRVEPDYRWDALTNEQSRWCDINQNIKRTADTDSKV